MILFPLQSLIVWVDVLDMRTMLWSIFVRISYAMIVSGIVGGVWCLGAVQQNDLRLQKRGLPAPPHCVQAESDVEVSSIADSD